MIPGPTYVYECPDCGNLLSKGSLTSGNSYGMKMFSDGKRIAPMLPEFPALIRCEKCQAFVWIYKLKELGTYDWGDTVDAAWKDAQKAFFPGIEDYFESLEKRIATGKTEEAYIRRQIWWAYNDRLRNGKEIFNGEEDEMRWRKNLQELLTLFDPTNDEHQILAAEIHRNLGEFEHCVRVIEGVHDKDLSFMKDKIIEECRRQNRWVVPLN